MTFVLTWSLTHLSLNPSSLKFTNWYQNHQVPNSPVSLKPLYFAIFCRKPLYFVSRRTCNFVVTKLECKTASCHLRSKFDMVSELQKVRPLHCNLLRLDAGRLKICIFIKLFTKESHLHHCFSIHSLRALVLWSAVFPSEIVIGHLSKIKMPYPIHYSAYF